ncbi:hypothetical protein FOL47_007751 [Perkinsus chesapeaki]|uniref:Leucine-rich repeat-containing protein 40 n=1 Tax=Perkinsus chesapeaki TaxID=330153 RepID=A0A7J6MV58_PERCH|nr:hypothetical protein FOL47_007751 [Perkinsus chesapeaki]
MSRSSTLSDATTRLDEYLSSQEGIELPYRAVTPNQPEKYPVKTILYSQGIPVARKTVHHSLDTSKVGLIRSSDTYRRALDDATDHRPEPTWSVPLSRSSYTPAECKVSALDLPPAKFECDDEVVSEYLRGLRRMMSTSRGRISSSQEEFFQRRAEKLHETLTRRLGKMSMYYECTDGSRKPEPILITGFEEFDEESKERRRESGRVLIGSTEDIYAAMEQDTAKDKFRKCTELPHLPREPNQGSGCRFTSIDFMDSSWHNTQREKIDFTDACGYIAPTVEGGPSSHLLSHGCQLWLAGNYSAGNQRQLEREALVDLFYELNGMDWRNRDGWLIGEPCWNDWYGVECNEFGYVRSISLADNRLKGQVPASLSYLIYLEEIYLHNTADAFHSFPNRDANRITGSLPRLGSLRRLQVLDVSGNEIEALPYDLYRNTNLEIVSASRNRLTKLPTYLGRLRNLKILQLQDNLIDDMLPIAEICKLLSIQVFDLGNNTISGKLSNCLSRLDPLLFDISASHPRGMPVGKGLIGEFPTSVIPAWKNIQDGYLSVYFQFYMTGHIASACSDIRYCYQFMYDTHGDLTWASAGEIPDVVMETVNLARGQSV